MAILPVSHNTIPVSSRPACLAGGYAVKISSSWPKLLATFEDRLAQGGNRQAGHASQLCDFRIVLEPRTG
jgi:hypothetical protein